MSCPCFSQIHVWIAFLPSNPHNTHAHLGVNGAATQGVLRLGGPNFRLHAICKTMDLNNLSCQTVKQHCNIKQKKGTLNNACHRGQQWQRGTEWCCSHNLGSWTRSNTSLQLGFGDQHEQQRTTFTWHWWVDFHRAHRRCWLHPFSSCCNNKNDRHRVHSTTRGKTHCHALADSH